MHLNSTYVPTVSNWLYIQKIKFPVWPIRLYTSFFVHPNRERQAEYEACIRGNSFLEQHVFVETPEAEAWIRQNAPSAVVHNTDSFPTFKTMFAAGERGYINIIANADILFTDTVFRLRQVDLEKTALCISRWEESGPSILSPVNDIGSQDIWVWKGVFRCPNSMDFRMGTPGCDNRVAAEMESAGYTVANIVYDIVTIHKHASNLRSYPDKAVLPPYMRIQGTHLLATTIPAKTRSFWRRKTILHVGYPMAELQGEFKKNCDTYVFIHRDSNDLNQAIVRAVYKYRPDITFCQIQAPGILSLETAKIIRKVSYSINWTGDARRPTPDWFKIYAPHFDVTLFSNETDVREMRAIGYRAAFLNIGFETMIYNPAKDMEITGKDIVFMGNNYPGGFPLSQLRSDMVKTLGAEFGSSFGVWGNGWEESIGVTTESQEARVYRGCKMAISLSHYDLERYFSDRMLRIMGCSTLCLAKWYPGIEKDFVDGKHLVVWRDIPELITKIRYYLANPAETFEIGRTGSGLVHSEHAWDSRLRDLEQVMNMFPKLGVQSLPPKSLRYIITS